MKLIKNDAHQPVIICETEQDRAAVEMIVAGYLECAYGAWLPLENERLARDIRAFLEVQKHDK